MCGIITIINKDHSLINKDLLSSMTDTLIHRGPDGKGYYTFKNIGLGHRRLSIIDLSTKGAQPMEKHNLVLSYNGEIYNYMQLRKDLEELGVEFFSNSDSEVLLSGYKYWGPGFETKLNGMWSFVIYDLTTNCLYVSRDRYGMKPLYIYENETSIYFASEIKAFKVLANWIDVLNVSVVGDYLCQGLLHHKDQSIYENVFMHPAASYSIYNSSGSLVNRQKFYVIPEYKKDPISKIEVKDTFCKAVQDHLIADVEVATSLSGGIDSSSFAAVAVKINKSIHSFSYIPNEAPYNEGIYIQEMIDQYGLNSFSINPSFSDHIDAHVQAIKTNDAPALGMNLISHYLLYKFVKSKNIKVLLSGQGADELLAGYGTYYPYFLNTMKKKSVFRWIKESFFVALNYPGFIKKMIGKMRPQVDYNDFLIHPSPNKIKAGNFQTYCERMINEDMLPALLQFEDRNSMAHSVEGRLPFLDAHFSHLCHETPPEQKIRKGLRKDIFRKAMQGIVPTKILNRKDKIGFASPQEIWMEQNQNLFLEKIEQGIKNYPNWVRPEVLGFANDQIIKKKRRSYPFIWRLFSFFEFVETLVLGE